MNATYPKKHIPKIIMVRKNLPLTDTQIKAAKLTDKDYSSFDGGGIYLLIRANNFEI